MADDPRATHESPPTDLRFGAAVVSDGGRRGTISDLVPDMPGVPGGVRVSWDDDTISLVPRDAIAIEGDRIVVHSGDSDDAHRTARAAETAGSRSPAATTGDSGTLRAGEDLVVPIVEERITAEATWQEAGTVTFRLRSAEERRTVTAHPAREELDIEEVAVGRELAEGEHIEPRTEGDTTIIPVVAEEPVVVMRRVLVKELRVTRRRATEARSFEATVRRTVVETDTGGLAERVHEHGTDPAKEAAEAN
jgi:stress response protein YsnF